MPKKTAPRLSFTEVEKYIYSQTELTHKQIRDCLIAYGNLIKELAITPDRPREMRVNFLHLGDFKFVTRKGLKKGTVIKRIDVKTKQPAEYVVEEDKPDYEIIVFEPLREVREMAKKSIELSNTSKKKMAEITKLRRKNKNEKE